MWDLVSCRTLRFATLTESLFEAERQEEAPAAALCAALDWTSVLHHTTHGSERGMESSSNFINQHSLPSRRTPSTQYVREHTLSFHSGHPLCGDVSRVDQT